MGKLCLLGHGCRVPNFNLAVGGCGENRALIQVTPFDAVNLACMSRHNLYWLIIGRTQVPKFDGAIASRTHDLVLIAFIPGDIKSCVWGLKLPDYLDSILVDIQERDCASADHSKVLGLGDSELSSIKGTPATGQIAEIGLEALRRELYGWC